MTDSLGPRAAEWSDGEGRQAGVVRLGSWRATAAAARAALAVIPTPEDQRSRQKPLACELDRSANAPAPGAPSLAGPVSTGAPADLLGELTLAALREPASARPYDAERSAGLRRRVLQVLVGVADDVAGVDVRARPRDAWVVAEILAAGRLARALLDEEPVGSHS